MLDVAARTCGNVGCLASVTKLPLLCGRLHLTKFGRIIDDVQFRLRLGVLRC